MSAGIASVTRMIERLDLTSKRPGASEPLSACTMGTSNFPSRGVCEQGNVTFQSHDSCIKNSTIEVTPTAPSLISNTNTGQMEISLRQVCSWFNYISNNYEALLVSVFVIPDVANLLFHLLSIVSARFFISVKQKTKLGSLICLNFFLLNINYWRTTMELEI